MRTLEKIRREGLQALCDRLGQAGMIQFLQQFETGHGNYTKSRQLWGDRTSLEEIRETAVDPQQVNKRRKD